MRMSKVSFDPAPAAAAHMVLPQSEKRMSIQFYAPITGQVTLSNEPNVTPGNGIALLPGMVSVWLSVDKDGDCVQREWYAAYSGVIGVLGWIEALAWDLELGRGRGHDPKQFFQWGYR